MALGMLGLKVGMTQVYDNEGKIAPVTVLQIGPCPILLVRQQERDGYDAVQVGFQDKGGARPAGRNEVMYPTPWNRGVARPAPRPACCCRPRRIASRNATFANFVWRKRGISRSARYSRPAKCSRTCGPSMSPGLEGTRHGGCNETA